MADTVAFMVMPFENKPTGKSGKRVPDAVDFDKLWYQVHKPVLEELGYQAVRADADVGAFVIAEMIQRLAVADLVLADISLANANVYYEVGVRQAAKERGCVLVAAEWADPVFDLKQMRRLQYPLADGAVGKRAAERAKKVLRAGLVPLVEGRSPVFEAVPEYPKVDPSKLPVFQDLVDTLSSFDAEVEAVRETPGQKAREERTRQLQTSHGGKPVVRETAVLALLRLVRDNLDWPDVVAYVDSLPDRLQRHPLVMEQRLLALSKQKEKGDPAGAAAALKKLIRDVGPTSERWGLLGGRYKQLRDAATTKAERVRYLDLAIEAYEEGMRLDLNDFYPTSNLPRLYRSRGRDGDEQKAVVAAMVTVAACQRSIDLRTDNEWTRQTLLGAAFDSGDVEEARTLLPDIQKEGAVAWQLKSTLKDLETSLKLQQDPEVKRGLGEILEELRELAGGSG
jgi:hypothetical protein